MSGILQFVVDSLTAGSYYALFALGIALIFGIMQLVNFAHGELIMVGAYAVFLLQALPWPLVVVLVLVIVTVTALIMERIAFRPIRGASPATLLITSFAISFLLQNLARMFFGSLPKSVDLIPILRETMLHGPVTIGWLNVITVATTVILLSLLALFMSRTRVGVQMRAAAEDFEMARLCGIRSNRVVATAFALGGLLAGVGAILLVGQTGGVTVGIGLTPVLFGFTAAAVGGLGSLPGAVAGGFLLGLATTFLQQVLPYEFASYRDAFLFVGVFALMALRPGGLFRVAALNARV